MCSISLYVVWCIRHAGIEDFLRPSYLIGLDWSDLLCTLRHVFPVCGIDEICEIKCKISAVTTGTEMQQGTFLFCRDVGHRLDACDNPPHGVG